MVVISTPLVGSTELPWPFTHVVFQQVLYSTIELFCWCSLYLRALGGNASFTYLYIFIMFGISTLNACLLGQVELNWIALLLFLSQDLTWYRADCGYTPDICSWVWINPFNPSAPLPFHIKPVFYDSLVKTHVVASWSLARATTLKTSIPSISPFISVT